MVTGTTAAPFSPPNAAAVGDARSGFVPQDGSVAALARRIVAIGESPSAAAVRHERKARVQAAIETLPEMDREVLVLRYIEQLSTSDAAAVMGVSANTFAQRHVRAIRRLRAVLSDDVEG